MNEKRRFAGKRKAGGGTIAEFGPALFLLLICFFFPLLDLMGVVVYYVDCSWLNHQQSHEAALVNYEDAIDSGGTIQQDVVEAWRDQGVGKFVNLVDFPVTKVSYRSGQIDNTGVTDKMVTVTTTFNVRPFLALPGFGLDIPGLTVPMSFTISSDALMENPDNAQS